MKLSKTHIVELSHDLGLKVVGNKVIKATKDPSKKLNDRNDKQNVYQGRKNLTFRPARGKKIKEFFIIKWLDQIEDRSHKHRNNHSKARRLMFGRGSKIVTDCLFGISFDHKSKNAPETQASFIIPHF